MCTKHTYKIMHKLNVLNKLSIYKFFNRFVIHLTFVRRPRLSDEWDSNVVNDSEVSEVEEVVAELNVLDLLGTKSVEGKKEKKIDILQMAYMLTLELKNIVKRNYFIPKV